MRFHRLGSVWGSRMMFFLLLAILRVCEDSEEQF